MSFGELHGGLHTLQIVRGRVVNTPSSDTADLFVTVPAFHAHERWGPCPFMPRVNAAGNQALPSAGDDCLVALDENGDSYVIGWWP